MNDGGSYNSHKVEVSEFPYLLDSYIKQLRDGDISNYSYEKFDEEW